MILDFLASLIVWAVVIVFGLFAVAGVVVFAGVAIFVHEPFTWVPITVLGGMGLFAWALWRWDAR